MFKGKNGLGKLGRITIHVDAANVMKGKPFGPDWLRLKSLFGKYGDVVRATFYTAAFPDDRMTKDLHRKMCFAGWTLVVQPVEALKNGGLAGNLDLELLINMVDERHELEYETVVLLAGDHGYRKPLEHLKALGKHVIVGFWQNYRLSTELLCAADEFIDLTSLRDEVEYVSPRSAR